MNDPLNWFAIAAAWFWAWLGDRPGQLWTGEVHCNCTCEVQPAVCHQGTWLGELLKVFFYVVVGLVIGRGRDPQPVEDDLGNFPYFTKGCCGSFVDGSFGNLAS